MGLGDEKYIRFTTFRRDGTPVGTPVWSVPLDDGKIGFWTSSQSGKAKRLRHTADVTVQPCDARGRPRAGTEAVGATAQLVSGAELETIRARVVAKYGGVQTRLAKASGKLIGILRGKPVPYGDRGVVVTLNGAGSPEAADLPEGAHSLDPAAPSNPGDPPQAADLPDPAV